MKTLLYAFACAWIAAPASGQFKAQSVGVIVDVVVTDLKGNLVKGLKADDFRVFENDVEQKVSSFEGPIGEAVQAGAPSPTHSRFVTIVMDQANIQQVNRKLAVDSAAQYVEQLMGPQDFVSVYSVGSRLRMISPFSNDRAKIVAAIRALNQRANEAAVTGTGRASVESEILELRQQEAQEKDPALAAMLRAEWSALEGEAWLRGRWQARALFLGLRATAQALAPLPGRKNIVLFSEGFVSSPEAANELSAVVDAAARANVAIYAIDPGGLSGNTAASAQSSRTGSTRRGIPNSAAQQSLEIITRGPDDLSGGFSKFDAIGRTGIESQFDDLRRLTQDTGGFLVKNRNDLLPSLIRIDRDLRESYTLVYQPKNGVYDGSFQTIRVALLNKGYRLRYRSGYSAMPPGEERLLTPAAAQLIATAENGSLKPDAAAVLNAALLFNSKGEHQTPVSVWVPALSGIFKKEGDGYGTTLSLVLTARDSSGRLTDVQQKSFPMHLGKDQWREAQKVGLRISSTLSAPKLEALELQAIVQCPGGKTITGRTRLDIAPSEGARATSLLLTPRIDAAAPVPGDSDALQVQNYRLTIPKQPVFSSADKLTLYFGIGGISADPATGKPLLKLGIALKSGTTVLREIPADGLFQLPDQKDRLFFLNQIPLTGLSAGPYSIEATIRDVAKNTLTVQRSEFKVQ